MRVLLKKDFTIELLSVDKVINVNDVMVSRLEVEVEENFLLPGERLWVVFSKTKDNPTDDITKEIQLGTDNKTYSVAIPQAVVMQEGKWYFILSARKYYSNEKYFTRKATEPYEFTVAGGLWIDEGTGEVVNNGTVQTLYEMATEKLAIEQNNYGQIFLLQEDVAKAKTDILAEKTERQAMDAAISEAANAARGVAEEARASAINANVQVETLDRKLDEEIASVEKDIKNIEIDLATVKGIEGDFRNLEGKVAYSKASSISVSVDPKTYVVTFTLQADGGLPISSASIDLPIESVVSHIRYNETTNNVEIELVNGEVTELPIGKFFRGFNIIAGNGKGAIQQVDDGVADGFDFTDKNPTATEQDPSLTGILPYGGVGNYSSAFGGKSSAMGKRSHAEGTTTVAKGDYSHVEGNNSVTLGANSHAEGKHTTTLGENAHAEGFDTFAEGYISHSEGYKTHAQGACSHAEGNGTEAIQDQAHAEGSQTHALGYASHTEGEGTVAENHACHAEGKDTQAKGYCSHSEGISTFAIGMYSHAQGGWTYANGDYSVASGNDSIADYHCDFVHGEGLRTTYEHQTVFGKYNDASNWGNNRPLLMIGNGKSDSERSNAFEVRENGEVYAGGKLLQGTKLYRHTINLPNGNLLVFVSWIGTRMTGYVDTPIGNMLSLAKDIYKYVLKAYLQFANGNLNIITEFFYMGNYDEFGYYMPSFNQSYFATGELNDTNYIVEEI